MSQPLTLTNNDIRCEIKPELGGCITGLWLRDVPVLRSTPAHELSTVRQAGSFPLVPFSNRIGHATLEWNSTSHPLVKNFSPEPHAIHGVGWLRPWTVLESDANFAMLSFEHQPDAAWPFAFDASQVFRVTANALEMTLSITNQSDKAAPAGLGFHPYFVKRPHSRITFEATGRWEMNNESLPTHRSDSSGLNVRLAGLDVDHCFEGWNGVVNLHDELLSTRITSDMNRMVVFTNDSKDFVAIEPVSHVNNALNMTHSQPEQADALGVTILQPGESMSAQMTITVEAIK
jgi:aldose 1-epimerase